MPDIIVAAAPIKTDKRLNSLHKLDMQISVASCPCSDRSIANDAQVYNYMCSFPRLLHLLLLLLPLLPLLRLLGLHSIYINDHKFEEEKAKMVDGSISSRADMSRLKAINLFI